MKLTLTSTLVAALATIVSSAAIERRDALPGDLTFRSSAIDGLIYPTLMYAGNSAYIGNIKYSTYSEPLSLSSGGQTASFLSIHSSPTGSQRMYIFPTQSKPIGFTIPHSNAVPADATTVGFGSAAGNLVNGDASKWKACPVTTELFDTGVWQIYWEGAEVLTNCVPVQLTVVDNTCSA